MMIFTYIINDYLPFWRSFNNTMLDGALSLFTDEGDISGVM